VVPVLNADSVTSTPCHHALLLQENPHLPRKGGAAGRAGTDTGNTGKLSWLHLTSSRPFHYDAVMSRASHIHLIYSTVEYGTGNKHACVYTNKSSVSNSNIQLSYCKYSRLVLLFNFIFMKCLSLELKLCLR